MSKYVQKIHKHTVRYQPVWDFLMSHSASQICPTHSKARTAKTVRLRTLYRCAGLVLQDPCAVRVASRVEARESHSNQCICSATCEFMRIPFYTIQEPTTQTTILCSTNWHGNSVLACGCQTSLDSQISIGMCPWGVAPKTNTGLDPNLSLAKSWMTHPGSVKSAGH